jgi:hypothetical protein
LIARNYENRTVPATEMPDRLDTIVVDEMTASHIA